MKTSLTGRGLALIVVVGILGVLAVLAVAFVMMAQLERRASEQRINGARAYLLARSGIEDALARLELGQDPAYGGENWDGSADGLLSAFEADQEIYRRTGAGTPADLSICPVRQAMRPSFFARVLPSQSPATLAVEGRQRGYSGVLAGDYGRWGNSYALKVSSSNAGIFINGGALDAQDRDPDGPGADASAFLLNPGAAAEVAPLLPNKVPDHRDFSMEGPNGFLVRLLNNLDAVVSNGATSNLGAQIVEARPLGGYKSLDELKPILSQPFVQNPSLVQQVQNLITPPADMTRYEKFKPYLTRHAWVDPKVVKPQPMDGRPHRWEDIDDAHRIGTEANEISGVHYDTRQFKFSSDTDTSTDVDVVIVSGPLLCLNPGISGDGKEEDPLVASIPWTPTTAAAYGTLGGDGPWTQTITATNAWEGIRNQSQGQPQPTTYPVRWERTFVYAWSQLRLAPPPFEPRAPVSLNAAAPEVLASVFLGLKGTYLQVWDGSAGWDTGFGWNAGAAGYPYPSQGTEDTPWIRTRVDYGMTYGASTGKPPSRPWYYGAAQYDPHAPPPDDSSSSAFRRAAVTQEGGKPVIQAAPLGRLKEASPFTPAQAAAIAAQCGQGTAQCGPLRTWAQFRAFVGLLPRWEDLNDDGILDGAPYPVVGMGGYARRVYRREDLDSDGLMTREVFTPGPALGSWALGILVWPDPHLPRAAVEAAGQAPGLTFLQKDILKAMANPNTDVNDFNPDANLRKEVDKTDLCGINADSASYVHTTELSLDEASGPVGVYAVGRVLGRHGRLLASRVLGAALEWELYRDTTQEDFMRDYRAGQKTVFSLAGDAPYPLAGNQALVSYPEPQTDGEGRRAGNAHYDGQIGLGFIGVIPGAAQATGITTGGQLIGGTGSNVRGDLTATVTSNVSTLPETLRGDLFDTADATGSHVKAVPDIHGPYHLPLLGPAGMATGGVFPDGIYSEKDRSLKYRMAESLAVPETVPDKFYVACWAKLNWFPEASPRAHALVSFSGNYPQAELYGPVPLQDVAAVPAGLYFVPARNNAWQGDEGVYAHYDYSGATQGGGWPCRALLWGAPHTMWASDCLNRRGIETPPMIHPMGRLEAHRWVHLACLGTSYPSIAPGVSCTIVGRTPSSLHGGGWSLPFDTRNRPCKRRVHSDGADNHLRFGEIAGLPNMNYVADATFACVRAADEYYNGPAGSSISGYQAFFTSSSSPAALGRYCKADGAAYASPKLPAGARPLRITWTEIPCTLWFDENNDGWLGDPPAGGSADPGDLSASAQEHYSVSLNLQTGNVGGWALDDTIAIAYAIAFYRDSNKLISGTNKLISDAGTTPSGISADPSASANGGVSATAASSADAWLNQQPYAPRNDRFGSTVTGLPVALPNGKRDVHIALEIWDDGGLLARFDDPAADNRIPRPRGRLYYKAVFVNEWDAATRANYPLDVTPFLDDVTVSYMEAGGPRIISYQMGEEN